MYTKLCFHVCSAHARMYMCLQLLSVVSRQTSEPQYLEWRVLHAWRVHHKRLLIIRVLHADDVAPLQWLQHIRSTEVQRCSSGFSMYDSTQFYISIVHYLYGGTPRYV